VRIIDGYNVIGVAGEFGIALSLPDKEERLIRLLSSFRSRRRSRQGMLVVFDGHYGRLAAGPRRYSQLGIEVEWALGETADAVIVRKVRSAASPREVEVVTSDELVLRAIAGCGAQGIRSPAFLAELSRTFVDEPAAEKPEAPSQTEVAEWLERFGDGS
jgi:predicted RNA-binding protein with PIN domain